MSSTPLRIGLIGLDTSHVIAFAKLLNQKDDPNHVPGGRVTVGFPGGTRDWDKSWGRVEGFTNQLRDELGVQILDSPEAVAEQSDIVFLSSVDGRVHRGLFEQIVSFKRPTFIDKPFTASVEDAQAILSLAEAQGVPVMSCSSLRYAQAFTAALEDASKGELKGLDVFGPMAMEPALPGLFWYGVHGVEMVVTALGAGCREVRAVKNDGTDVITLTWDDGRIASLRGNRAAHGFFGATLHREKGFQAVDVQTGTKPYYASLLDAIMASLPHGRSAIPAAEMLEVIRVIEAANEARETGRPVELEAVTVG